MACSHLALTFNKALDQVSAMLPDPTDPRTANAAIGIDPSFKILDDSWLFESGEAATPEREYDAYKKRSAKEKDEERAPDAAETGSKEEEEEKSEE